MQWLAEICVKRPIFATVLILVICVVGLAGYGKLGVDRFPQVDFPVVTVTTRLPGAAPEDVESEITDKIEEAVNSISSIDELRSVSSEGISQVFITFLLEKDVDVASQEVRDRVNTIIPELPKNIDLPTVGKVDPGVSPVLYISLHANRPIQEITEFADKKVRRLIENISGVGQVTVLGGRKRQVNVFLDPVRLRSEGLTAANVQRAILGQNLTMPGGRLDTGPEQLTLRIHGRVTHADDIGDVVVAQKDNHSIKIRDIGRIEDGAEEAQSSALKDGVPTVVLTVRKQSGSNTVEVADTVRSRLADIRKTLPEGYALDVVRDDSAVIRTSVDAVKEHLVLGAIFAALIVLLFLGNFRSTLIAAIAIPTSIIGTFALMWIENFTLNTITLLALALAVGIVIDDAIVVLENIFRHVEEKGMDPFEAAVAGTKEIGLAVLATTLSLIAVFLPVAFMGGIPGRFLKSFGVTMAFAIGVSLFVSFSLTPMMAARWLKAPQRDRDGKIILHRGKLERAVDVFYRPIESFYLRILTFVMRKRWTVVLASFLALASCFPLTKIASKGFLPVNDEAQFDVLVRAPEGTSLASTQLIGERIAREIRKLPIVDSTLVTVADDEQRTQNLARIYTHLVDPRRRKTTQVEAMAVVRDQIVSKQPSWLRISLAEVSAFGGGGFSSAKVQYTVSGPDLKKLQEYTEEIVSKLKKVPGAVDVDSSLIVGKPELGVYVDRAKAADLGVQILDVADTLRVLVGGLDVTNFSENGEEYPIHVRADSRFRADTEGLRLLTVPSARLGVVPLDDVVTLKAGTGPAAINRLNRRRQVSITANPAPGVGESVIADAALQIIKDEKMPAEYQAATAGSTKEMGRTAANFLLAFVLSFIFMYLVLAAQFESWLHPLTILLSLPLTLPFAIFSIVIFKQALDIFSLLGILVLFGVIKKNAILQIDHTNQLRARGMPRREAILQANKDRLRPILMTTLAFVAGMIPLVTSQGIGSGFNRATAGVVVGGQTLSLLLTLLATPVAYSLFDDASNWAKRLFSSQSRAVHGEQL